jgi:hypothetical protein
LFLHAVLLTFSEGRQLCTLCPRWGSRCSEELRKCRGQGKSFGLKTCSQPS